MKKTLPSWLYDGMTAAQARQLGVDVPGMIPDVAKLKFRKQRFKLDNGDTEVFNPSTKAGVEVETLWTWRWYYAYDVGPEGKPEKKEYSPGDPEIVLTAARELVKRNTCLEAAYRRSVKTVALPPCTCTYCKLKQALADFDNSAHGND